MIEFPEARKEQLPPEWDWNVWLILAGRGWGKTLTGAKWVLSQAYDNPGSHIALIGRDHAHVREVMVKGQSGIIASSPTGFVPIWNERLRQLMFPNGSTAYSYSSFRPDALCGPRHHFGWSHAMANWKNLEATWEYANYGMRLGKHPQMTVTTTPRPLKILRELVVNPFIHVTYGSTFDNAGNLAPATLRALKSLPGTLLGRQELFGQILDPIGGSTVA
jgi:phage terminase large subunit-like protein